MTEIEIIQAGKFYGAKGFDFLSLKEALLQAVQEEGEGFLFFADKVMGLMVAMPPSPTTTWQKHPSRSRFNKGGWYETNLIEFGQDFGF